MAKIKCKGIPRWETVYEINHGGDIFRLRGNENLWTLFGYNGNVIATFHGNQEFAKQRAEIWLQKNYG